MGPEPELQAGQSVKSEVVVPTRGTIFDRNGQPLAQTVRQPVIGIARSLVQDADVLKSELARLFEITYDRAADSIAKISVAER